jgi:hypothetical protein
MYRGANSGELSSGATGWGSRVVGTAGAHLRVFHLIETVGLAQLFHLRKGKGIFIFS